MKIINILFLLTISYTTIGQVKNPDSISNSQNKLDSQKQDTIKVQSLQKEIPIHISLEKGNDKDWTDYFSAILTPIVAFFAIWLGFRQYQTQLYQVRLDLFERRIKIIEDTRATLTEIDKHFSGDGEKINLELFRAAYRHSQYLFSNDIIQYLKSLDEKIGSLEGIELELKSKSISAARENELHQLKENTIVWLREQRIEHESKFAKFMTLNKI